jgi:O-antigen/teichoic acid export membrane protein
VIGTALSLMISTVLSAGLTFGFWVAAARLFDPEPVGRISAQVASMTLLAAVAQLNLHTLYARFLPTAGRRTGRLVLAGYGASALTAGALATGYLALGLDGGLVGDGLAERLLFTVGVIATAIFLIQDGVLTALRRASGVPVKNMVSAAGKLALLPVLAIGMAPAALLMAWVVPVVTVMVLWNGWILFRLIPKHAAWRTGGEPVEYREVLRFASAEYVNGIVNNVLAFLPPLLVTQVLGTTTGAYFYLPWVIGVSVTTMLWNVVSSFVVEASGDTAGARRHLDRSITMIAAVAGGGGLVLAAAAAPLLTVLGPDYAANGTETLRLIGLSLPFTGVVVLYGSFAIMEKRMWRMVAIQSCAAVAFLAGAWFNLGGTGPYTGAVSPAVALLLAQATLATALLPGLVSRIRAVRAGTADWADATPAEPGAEGPASGAAGASDILVLPASPTPPAGATPTDILTTRRPPW